MQNRYTERPTRPEPEKLSAEGTEPHVCDVVSVTNDHGGEGACHVTAQTRHRVFLSVAGALG